MKITIGHLFYDLLNLYGENGNIMALQKALGSQGIEVEIKNLSIYNEPWNLEELDVIYIGTGTEQNQILALNTLMKYKEVINQMIMNNKLFIATGNSIELFGKSINSKEQKIEGLGIFDYTAIHSAKRLVAECVFKYDELEEKILGFKNNQGEINDIKTPLFTVEKGIGNNKDANIDGFRYNNFYGTYLIGPLLARNPKLLEKICVNLIKSKSETFNIKNFNLELEIEAHNKFLEKYM